MILCSVILQNFQNLIFRIKQELQIEICVYVGKTRNYPNFNHAIIVVQYYCYISISYLLLKIISSKSAIKKEERRFCNLIN